MNPLATLFEQTSIVAECLLLHICGILFGLLLSKWIRQDFIPYIKKNKTKDEDEEE